MKNLPMRPHKEQNGFVYTRVHRGKARYVLSPDCVKVLGPLVLFPEYTLSDYSMRYDDEHPNSRIISSRRVEEDVETGDYLKMCAEEGLTASKWPDHWLVFDDTTFSNVASAPTLRAAYHRYKAVADGDGAC